MTDDTQSGSEPSSNENTDSESTMLARAWSIAANARQPADYGILEAPTFETERRRDGTLVLFASSTADEPFMIVENPIVVRR